MGIHSEAMALTDVLDFPGLFADSYTAQPQNDENDWAHFHKHFDSAPISIFDAFVNSSTQTSRRLRSRKLEHRQQKRLRTSSESDKHGSLDLLPLPAERTARLLWRKYGQKTLKGKLHQGRIRCYYKCCVASCNVKKIIEKPANDLNKVLHVKYMSTHNHSIAYEDLEQSGVATLPTMCLAQSMDDGAAQAALHFANGEVSTASGQTTQAGEKDPCQEGAFLSETDGEERVFISETEAVKPKLTNQQKPLVDWLAAEAVVNDDLDLNCCQTEAQQRLLAALQFLQCTPQHGTQHNGSLPHTMLPRMITSS